MFFIYLIFNDKHKTQNKKWLSDQRFIYRIKFQNFLQFSSLNPNPKLLTPKTYFVNLGKRSFIISL